MLFDIRGRRRTLVRWVYGGLAVIFSVGFVGFGVGSDVGGGLLGSGHGGSARGHGDAGSIEEQADELRDRVRSDPRDRLAWRQLSLVLASLAFEQTGGHGGTTQLADDGLARLGESVVAYEEHVKLLGERKPARARDDGRSFLQHPPHAVRRGRGPTARGRAPRSAGTVPACPVRRRRVTRSSPSTRCGARSRPRRPSNAHRFGRSCRLSGGPPSRRPRSPRRPAPDTAASAACPSAATAFVRAPVL